MQERGELGFHIEGGFTAHLYSQKAFGAGADTENWLNFGAGLLSPLNSTSQFPSLGREDFPVPTGCSALLGHLGKFKFQNLNFPRFFSNQAE